MKTRTSFVSITLACLLLMGSAPILFAAGPMTWSSFVNAGVFYDPTQNGGSDVISRFTPRKAITVTRIEVQAAQGPVRLIFSPSFQTIACTNAPGFTVKDANSSFTLALPSANQIVTGNLNPSSADSGPLKLSFPADAKIVLTMVQGDQPDPSTGATGCFTNNVNITVQYMTSEGDD